MCLSDQIQSAEQTCFWILNKRISKTTKAYVNVLLEKREIELIAFTICNRCEFIATWHK